MAISQDVVTLNDFSDLRVRESRSGVKARTSINVQSEPILHDFDERRTGRPVAEAIRDVLAAKIRGIAAKVSVETVLKRKYIAAAYRRGEPYAVRQYEGGRTGSFTFTDSKGKTTRANPPPEGNEDRMFNFSGRLAEGLFVRENPTEGGFTVNMPANRFNVNQGGTWTVAQLQRALDKLGQLVPEFRDAGRLARDPEVLKAVEESVDGMINIAKGRLAAAKRRRVQAILDLAGLRNLSGLLR